MGRFIKGDVVVVPFPFSDLTMSKRRPTRVIAELSGEDLIFCQITSQDIRDDMLLNCSTVISIQGLNKPSNIRPNRLFTAHHMSYTNRTPERCKDSS